MSNERSEQDNRLVDAIKAMRYGDTRYYLAGCKETAVTIAPLAGVAEATDALPSNKYDYAIVYDTFQDIVVMTQRQPAQSIEVMVAKEWLSTAPMEHGTYLGEHDEAGAVFKIDGVRMTGPSVADFASAGLAHPQAAYNAFTQELVARWNRGPVE